MKVDDLDHLVLTVADVGVTAAWYSRVLGMTPAPFATAGGPRMALRFGDRKINLHPRAGYEPKAARPMPGSADLCFLTSTLDGWADHLAREGVAVEEGPVRRTGATGPITSLYLRDPDGNLIEVAARD